MKTILSLALILSSTSVFAATPSTQDVLNQAQKVVASATCKEAFVELVQFDIKLGAVVALAVLAIKEAEATGKTAEAEQLKANINETLELASQTNSAFGEKCVRGDI